MSLIFWRLPFKTGTYGVYHALPYLRPQTMHLGRANYSVHGHKDVGMEEHTWACNLLQRQNPKDLKTFMRPTSQRSTAPPSDDALKGKPLMDTTQIIAIRWGGSCLLVKSSFDLMWHFPSFVRQLLAWELHGYFCGKIFRIGCFSPCRLFCKMRNHNLMSST